MITYVNKLTLTKFSVIFDGANSSAETADNILLVSPSATTKLMRHEEAIQERSLAMEELLQDSSEMIFISKLKRASGKGTKETKK